MEITHAALLPFDEGQAILWCRDACGGVGFTETYLWAAASPGAVDVVPVPGASSHNNLFCAGHTWDRDGRLVVVGGNDYLAGCPGTCGGTPNVGHVFAYELDPFASSGPAWTALSSTMAVARWYPTVIPLGGTFLGVDDSLYVTGHISCPTTTPPQAEQFEIFRVGSNQFTLVADNATYDTPVAPGQCDARRVNTSEYPRLHQLKNGYVMWADAFNGPNDPCGLGSGNALSPVTAFFDYTHPLGCSSPAERFHIGCSPGVGFVRRHDANSVQIVFPDPAQPTVWHEVVYLIGGSAQGIGPVANVDKITDPGPGVTWDSSLPPMHEPKFKANAVLGLDGSITVFGGRKQLTPTTFAPVLKPEGYEPPELFANSTGQWEQLAVQSTAREYHSVALLLPDGRILSGGGEDIYPTQHGSSEHTVEIFSPGYLFRGRRPTIASYPLTLGLNSTDQVTITLPVGKTVRHFALVRLGSVTHAFDASQRYVRLHHVQQGTSTTYFITTPPDAHHAPRGFYMLTVVDSSGVASVAKMVLVM